MEDAHGAQTAFDCAPSVSRQNGDRKVINNCIVVADTAEARFFLVLETSDPRRSFRLEETGRLSNPDVRRHGARSQRVKSERNTNRQAGPMHPIGAQRERHRLEQDRRFGTLIVEHAAHLVAEWKEGRVLLIAEPHMLGLIREALRHALRREIRFDELARDYTGFSVGELERTVAGHGLI